MGVRTLDLYVDCFLHPDHCCVTFDSSLIGIGLLLKERVLGGNIAMAVAAAVEYPS